MQRVNEEKSCQVYTNSICVTFNHSDKCELGIEVTKTFLYMKLTTCYRSLVGTGLTLYLLGNFACFFVVKINFFENFFQEHPHQQFGSRSGLTSCPSWSGSNLFAKVISRRHQEAKSYIYVLNNMLVHGKFTSFVCFVFAKVYRVLTLLM